MQNRSLIQYSLFFLLLLFSSFRIQPADTLSGKVIGVKDGDTIDILYNNNKLTIRLAHIDCPEKKQPFGQVAKKFMSDNCYGQVVTIQHKKEYDRNKRLIGEVINAKGANLNKELVKAGLAWHFKKYSTDTVYAKLELVARKQKAGLWASPGAVAPGEWRK
ncbi:MAG: thermonuclease family protein [Chitinophagaceae bacterium]|nr:thermonuclease family protein [Chitinophagaceae bacterium]